MSVVVRMEMPSCCHDCPFEADQWDYPICRVTGRSEGYRFDARNNRMVDCPIVCQLPEGHGRLGDLDELAAGCDDPYWCRWLSEIEDAPTIVPAEAKRKVDAHDAVAPTDTPTDTPTVAAERSET